MVQAFDEFLVQYFREKRIRDVVEVGSDVQLELALKLARHCSDFYSVNLPEDHQRMQGWYELYQGVGNARNIHLLSGNAVHLSGLIGHADLILLQNVLIDGNGTDTDLMLKYRKEGCSREQWIELVDRLLQAEEDAYREFLRVANPGYVVRFGRPESERFREMLVSKLQVDPMNIQTIKLLSDSDVWEAYVIDNS